MLILQLMVKNESRIIARCIESAINIVDAVYILDTGSTDATKEVAEKTLIDSGKPFKIESTDFINFGESRTLSFLNCRKFIDELGWDRKTTYCLLLDGDMVIQPSKEFKSFPLGSEGYKILQKDTSIEYYNIRLLNAAIDWKCIGSTHEYWSAEGTIPHINKSIIVIDDKNDGGSKSDKFTRDARLLEEDLAKNPDNPRTVFYLAQTYKDLGRHRDAIMTYKCRILMRGWKEEIWYSYFKIGLIYETMGEFDKMELWLNRAYKNNPDRAEPLYHLVKHNRVLGNHYKAYHYYLLGKSIPYPKNDILFIDHHVYTYLFDYEYSILAYYVSKENPIDNLKHIVSYINKYTNNMYIDNCFNNLIHYIKPLGNERSYCFPVLTLDDELGNKITYNPSSTSIIKHMDKWIMNVRYVNFTPLKDGSYAHDGKYIKTVNVLKYTDDIYRFDESASTSLLNEIDIFNDDTLAIQGYEDVRLFEFNQQLMFSATVWNKQAMVCYGTYDISNNILTDTKILHPPSPTTCEKNWLFLSHDDELKLIYQWYPMQICRIDEDNKLAIINEYEMPSFFSRARGSSNPFYYDDAYWCLVHAAHYSTPRIYYHYIVKLNKDTLRPEKYSLPFYFVKAQIEYCIGFHIKNDRCIFIFSQNDANTSTLQKTLTEFTWMDAI